MDNFFDLVPEKNGKIVLEISAKDLEAYSLMLISAAKSELLENIVDSNRERYLSKEEVKNLFNVCDATLWHWNKKNYLKKFKIGNKVRYRWSDIKKIIEK